MAKTFKGSFQRMFDLYTSDLSLNEIERLIKRDAPGVYDFYLRDTKKPDQRQGSIERIIKLIGNLFVAFLRKLTPARRALYSLVLFLFVMGYLASNWFWAGIAFILLNILLAFELADKLTAKDELEVAREIQMNLMPKQAPVNRNYDIACFSETAREVGGDYYDFIQPPHLQDTTFIIIGDVSGKGMSAALHMVQVQAILHHLIDQYNNPRDILLQLNRILRHVLRNGSFFTISLASINTDKEIHLCRAGHMPLLHYRKETRQCAEIIPSGIGLGLPDGGRFDESLEEIRVKTEPGDVLFFYTDGIVEAMNAHKEEFGDRRLMEVIAANADKPAPAIKDTVLTALAKFRGLAPPQDDLTMIVMKAV